MSNFWWVVALIVIFVLGQWLMIRPSAYDQKLLKLREAARKLGFSPKLVPQPDWLKTDSKQLIACYSLVVPAARLPYFRAEKQADNQWKTVVGTAIISQVALPVEAKYLLAVEGQANGLSLYWREAGEQAVAEPEMLVSLKTWLEALANGQKLG